MSKGRRSAEYRKFLKKNFPLHAKVVLKGRKRAKMIRILYPSLLFGAPLILTLLIALVVTIFREGLLLELNKNFSTLFEKIDHLFIQQVLYSVYFLGFSMSLLLGIIGLCVGFSFYRKDIFLVERAEAYTKGLWLQERFLQDAEKQKLSKLAQDALKKPSVKTEPPSAMSSSLRHQRTQGGRV